MLFHIRPTEPEPQTYSSEVYQPLTHRQQVLHGDDQAGVADQPVPQPQHASHGLHEQAAAEQHEVETGHQVAQAEDADARGPRDEDQTQHQPEEVAEHEDLGHVQVGPEGGEEGSGERRGSDWFYQV